MLHLWNILKLVIGRNFIYFFAMRQISQAHLNAYKSGQLSKLFKVIIEDPELSFEIRMANQVMIYYRKDKILTIQECKNGNFKVEILDSKYFKEGTGPTSFFDTDEHMLYTLMHTADLRDYLKQAKKLVHAYKMGLEFEVQQNIALGNHSFKNRFVVVDMEWQFSQEKIKAEDRISKTRIDLVLVDTLKNEEGLNDIYLAELKVGLGATEGSSGTIDHVNKTFEIINKPEACNALLDDVSNIIKQKIELGLLDGECPDLVFAPKPKMMLILAHRGNKEAKQLESSAKLAIDHAHEIGMSTPIVIHHNALITLNI